MEVRTSKNGDGRNLDLRLSPSELMDQVVYFAKLATAASSVLKTWNTVTSFVICRISWNFVPKLLRMSDAPWTFAHMCAATRMPSPALSIYFMLSMFRIIFFLPSAIRLFNFSRRAWLSSPSTMRPSSATTYAPSTSRSVIFSATVFRSGIKKPIGWPLTFPNIFATRTGDGIRRVFLFERLPTNRTILVPHKNAAWLQGWRRAGVEQKPFRAETRVNDWKPENCPI